MSSRVGSVGVHVTEHYMLSAIESKRNKWWEFVFYSNYACDFFNAHVKPLPAGDPLRRWANFNPNLDK